MADLAEARRAKAALKHALAGRHDVTAVGIAPDGTGPDGNGYELLVRVRGDEVTARAADVPRVVEGVHVRVRPGGTIRAQS